MRLRVPQQVDPTASSALQHDMGHGHAVAPPEVHEVLRAPGQPLDAATRSTLEPRFGHDFSYVRVHTNEQAAESARAVSAHAYAVGRHVVFDAGQYAPGTRAGQELLAHELAHVVQQGAAEVPPVTALPIASASGAAEREAARVATEGSAYVQEATAPSVQRRERPNGTPETQLGDGDWLVGDRVTEAVRWQRANLVNLIKQRPHEYTQPHERRDFYLWVYNYTSGLGFETRWPLAAYLVASGAARLSYGSPFENDVQVAARRGNQIIFDDVFPKLQALVSGPVLKGEAAQRWDAQTLSEEQTLVQTMYTSTASETIDKFGGYARQEGFLATSGAWAGFAQPHRGGRFHRVQDTPPFAGNIRSIDDRFNYGMRLADEFSTHPRTGPVSRPAAGRQYVSGEEFRRLDTRMGLHRLDAELDDFNVDEGRVIRLMQALSPDEQRELGDNRQRLLFLKSALDNGEMRRALSGLSNIPGNTRAFLLGEMQRLFTDLPDAVRRAGSPKP